MTWLSSFFAVLAVLLSCIGLYGLLAYSVARRTREIGIRMALGATPHAIMQIVGRESIVLGAVGVAVGLPCALIAGRFLRTMLYGLEPSDPATITVAAFALAALSAIAGLISHIVRPQLIRTSRCATISVSCDRRRVKVEKRRAREAMFHGRAQCDVTDSHR